MYHLNIKKSLYLSDLHERVGPILVFARTKGRLDSVRDFLQHTT